MVSGPLSSIILAECVHLTKFLAKSVELCMKARTQMHRSTMKLRSQQSTSIYFTSAERLLQLRLIVYFLKTRTSRHFFQQHQITQYLLYGLFKIEQRDSCLIKCKTTNNKGIRKKISRS